jgi:hypothetical protein
VVRVNDRTAQNDVIGDKNHRQWCKSQRKSAGFGWVWCVWWIGRANAPSLVTVRTVDSCVESLAISMCNLENYKSRMSFQFVSQKNRNGVLAGVVLTHSTQVPLLPSEECVAVDEIVTNGCRPIANEVAPWSSAGAQTTPVSRECAAEACKCEPEITCARENTCERVVTKDDPFGSTNDASLPPGVVSDFLLARMMRSPAPPPQQRRVEALENRTRIAPIDVEPAGTFSDARVVAAPLMFETSLLTTGQMPFFAQHAE